MNHSESQNGVEDVKVLRKLPFQRLKLPLKQMVDVAIPLHIQSLNQHIECIESLKNQNRPLQLRQEQLQASKAVQLLKADLYEIEQLNRQVRDEDQDKFGKIIEKSLKEAVESLSDFMIQYPDVLGPFLDAGEDVNNPSPEFPRLVCNSEFLPDSGNEPQEHPVGQAYLTSSGPEIDQYTSQNWSVLRKELMEIHSLICQFSSFVFNQQSNIKSLQSNIVETHENVRAGTEHLKKASVLKAATLPLAGAALGGLILGPLGALAGFKLLGSVACVAGGSVVGYKAGSKIKSTKMKMFDTEMKALTYPSRSTPNLSTSSEGKEAS